MRLGVEVDTTEAACTLALEYSDQGKDPVLQPFKGVVELIKLAARQISIRCFVHDNGQVL